MRWRRKWQPTPVFLPGESRDRGAWWAAVYGVAQSWTQLKRLSSSSSSIHIHVSILLQKAPVAQMVKSLPAMQDTQVRSLGQENPLEKGMGTHSSILAQRIPWTEEPGGLQSMGSQKVIHDRMTNTTTILIFRFVNTYFE